MKEFEAMTFAEIANHYAPRPEIVGPYSPWPRRRNRGRMTKAVTGIVAAGVLLHYAAPAFV